MKNHKYLWLISSVLFLLLISYLRIFYSSVITDSSGWNYTLHPGGSVRTLAQDLSGKNIINHPLMFQIWVRIRGQARSLKAGEYHFKPGTSLTGIVNQIATGKGVIYRSFILVPGWNFKQVRDALAANNKLHHTIDKLTDEQVMQQISQTQKKVEGQFFPDTYYFLEGSSDMALLKRAHQVMETRLNKAWESRENNLPFKNAYQALIAASLIEKEAYLVIERPVIAGVLINRLNKNMMLQFDPTVIYGMGAGYKGKLHKDDLQTKSPFNTYLHKGLPPTPIAMPTLDAINAVLHPQKHEFYYFVAKGDGSHQFSKTLTEHNQAIAAAEVRRKADGFFNEKLIERHFKQF